MDKSTWSTLVISGALLMTPLLTFRSPVYQPRRAVFATDKSELLQANPLQNIQGTIFYQIACPWERDYVRQDILADLKHWPVVDFASASALAETVRANTSRSPSFRPSIVVFNENSLENMSRVIQLLEPRVLIQLSDEWGDRPDMVELADTTPLLLRQYMHPHYPTRPNMYQIPLGYITNMTNGTSAVRRYDVPRMQDRMLHWAFVGNIKQDRKTMLDIFSAALGEFYHVSNDVSPAALFNVYKNAIFVPNGRGWRMLDCFRLYEASLSGAIPVIVGPRAEIRETFNFEGDIPPWIFEENWNTAATRCARLLKNTESLQNMQDQILKWWERQIIRARTRVTIAVTKR